MKLSVIILNYKVRHFLELCVQSVLEATKNFSSEVIVVDNHSQDGSCEMLKANYPQVKLIENSQNVGFPKGNNLGVSIARGEYICILNPDTVVPEDVFTKLFKFAGSIANLGIIGVKQIDGSGNFLPESKRGLPTPWVAFTRFSGLFKLSPKWFGKYYFPSLAENETGETEILVGSFMFMKKQVFESVGGFDEGCFMYADDIDLSYEVLKKGYSNFYFPQSTIIHFKGESTQKDTVYLNRFREAMNFFYKKHFKVNYFFDVALRVGIILFSILKLLKLQRVDKLVNRPTGFFYIGDNAETLARLQKKLPGKVGMLSLEKLKLILHGNNAEVIFDANSLNFRQIIECMATLKNTGFTFKILLKNSTFIVGSKYAAGRGEVINF